MIEHGLRLIDSVTVGRRRNYTFFVIAFFSLIAFLFPFWVKLFSNVFFAGLSEVKLFLFPVFLFFLALFYYKSQRNFSLNLEKNFFLVLLFLSLVSVFSIFLVAIFSSPQIIPGSLVVRDSFYSVNQITHIHSFKPILGWFVEFFPDFSYFFDAGYSFMSFIPFWFYVPFTIIFLLALFLLARLAPVVGQRNNYSMACFFLFGISSFSLFKNIVDGGPFNTEFLPALILFWVVVSGLNKVLEFKEIIFCFAIIVALIHLSVSFLELSTFFISLLIIFLFYLIIFGLFLRAEKKLSLFRILQSLTILSLIFFLFNTVASSNNLTVFAFSDRVIENNDKVIHSGDVVYFLISRETIIPQTSVLSNIELIPINRYFLLRGVSTKEVKGQDILSEFKIRAGTNHINVDQVDCGRNYPYNVKVKFFNFEGKNIQPVPGVVRIEPFSDDLYQVIFDGCVPGPYVVLADYLSYYDSSFVIVPPVH